MSFMDQEFDRVCAAHREVLDSVSIIKDQTTQAADIIIKSLKANAPVLLCGNGGSASDAQHFAGEIVGRFVSERRGLPAFALGADTATMTAIANDYGYATAFARQVQALGRPEACLVAISTSGNSESICKAAEEAKRIGMKVIGMTGQSGGKLKDIADVCLCVPTTTTARIQEMHIMLIHIICGAIDHAFPS